MPDRKWIILNHIQFRYCVTITIVNAIQWNAIAHRVLVNERTHLGAERNSGMKSFNYLRTKSMCSQIWIGCFAPQTASAMTLGVLTSLLWRGASKVADWTVTEHQKSPSVCLCLWKMLHPVWLLLTALSGALESNRKTLFFFFFKECQSRSGSNYAPYFLHFHKGGGWNWNR